MKKGILLLSFLLICIACKDADKNDNASDAAEMKFDKEKWKVTDPETIYAYREQMLDDLVDTLIATKKSRPLPKEEVLAMLGEPTRTDTLHLFYEVSQKHIGLLPFNAITLVIKLREDNSVEKVLIAE